MLFYSDSLSRNQVAEIHNCRYAIRSFEVVLTDLGKYLTQVWIWPNYYYYHPCNPTGVWLCIISNHYSISWSAHNPKQTKFKYIITTHFQFFPQLWYFNIQLNGLKVQKFILVCFILMGTETKKLQYKCVQQLPIGIYFQEETMLIRCVS